MMQDQELVEGTDSTVTKMRSDELFEILSELQIKQQNSFESENAKKLNNSNLNNIKGSKTNTQKKLLYIVK